MDNIELTKRLSHQYQGFIKGFDIGLFYALKPFSPFVLQTTIHPTIHQLEQWTETIPPRLVLGKRVEHFMSSYLNRHQQFKILAQNIQIFEEKITIGEIDFLIEDSDNSQVIHLEQVYKFYLYIPDADSQTINCWIGPNYKDSFQQKMDKLRQKQFPLLYHPNAQKIWQQLEIETSNIQQQLSFKAALFLPFGLAKTILPSLPSDAITGYWFHLDEFLSMNYQMNQFYIPQKQDWGVNPMFNPTWCTYEEINKSIQESLRNKRSPLCWMKTIKGTYSTFFVVWW